MALWVLIVVLRGHECAARVRREAAVEETKGKRVRPRIALRRRMVPVARTTNDEHYMGRSLDPRRVEPLPGRLLAAGLQRSRLFACPP